MNPETVKHIYTEMRRMYHPNYMPNERWDEIWPSVAIMLEQHGIDPGPFIEAQFRAIRPFPSPLHLTGERAVERYRSLMPDPHSEAVKRFYYEVDYLETRIKFMDIRRIVAEEPSTLSPLFRYCVCCRFKLHDLAAGLHDAALMQLLSSKESRQIYSSWVPPELWKEVVDA